MLKDKLELLTKEFATLSQKIKAKLTQKDTAISQKDQALTKTQQEKQEAVQKLETQLKENTADEQVLDQLIKEFQNLSNTL